MVQLFPMLPLLLVLPLLPMVVVVFALLVRPVLLVVVVVLNLAQYRSRAMTTQMLVILFQISRHRAHLVSTLVDLS